MTTYTPRDSTARVDTSYCCASVHNTYGVGFHQCKRKGTVERDGFFWCKTHDPVTVRERSRKKLDDWALRRREAKAKEANEKAARELNARALDAIRKIAAGHNDPRGLAIEVLGDE